MSWVRVRVVVVVVFVFVTSVVGQIVVLVLLEQVSRIRRVARFHQTLASLSLAQSNHHRPELLGHG